MAIVVVLHHRAARSEMDRSPRVPIRTPHAAYVLEETGLSWGDEKEVTGLQTCIQSLVNKPIRLVNVIQVMLVRRILPCQQRDFNLWEFDPAHHQTLSRLLDTMYEDAWKALFKGAEAPASTSEDHGYSSQRHASEVSYFHLLQDVKFFHSLTLCGI